MLWSEFVATKQFSYTYPNKENSGSNCFVAMRLIKVMNQNKPMNHEESSKTNLMLTPTRTRSPFLFDRSRFWLWKQCFFLLRVYTSNVCKCPILFSQETLLFLRYYCKHTVSMKHLIQFTQKSCSWAASKKCTGQHLSRKHVAKGEGAPECQRRDTIPAVRSRPRSHTRKRRKEPGNRLLLPCSVGRRCEPPPTGAATVSFRRPLPPPRQVPW